MIHYYYLLCAFFKFRSKGLNVFDISFYFFYRILISATKATVEIFNVFSETVTTR